MSMKKRDSVQKAIAPSSVKLLEGEVIALPHITRDEMKFCANYAIYANGAKAAREAGGFGRNNDREMAYELLTRPDIQAHIKAAREKLGPLWFDIGNQLIKQLDTARQADITELFDADGNLVDPQLWPEELKLLVNGIEIEEQMHGTGDEAFMVRTKKVKLEPRRAIIESLAKILGILRPEQQSPANSQPAEVVFNINVGGEIVQQRFTTSGE